MLSPTMVCLENKASVSPLWFNQFSTFKSDFPCQGATQTQCAISIHLCSLYLKAARSIHPLSEPLILTKVTGVLKPISVVFGRQTPCRKVRARKWTLDFCTARRPCKPVDWCANRSSTVPRLQETCPYNVLSIICVPTFSHFRCGKVYLSVNCIYDYVIQRVQLYSWELGPCKKKDRK